MARGSRVGVPLAAALLVLTAVVVVRALGFRQVSDDDYARVVIAETFAQAPRFDASGTSWLPFPFWVNGGAMMVFGRSLATARALAPVLAAAGAAFFAATLRETGAGPLVAIASVALGLLVPWNAWLCAAPVPEASTGLLVAAACIGVTRREARPGLALGLLAATLSRYEAWPVAGAFALYTVGAAFAEGPPRTLGRRLGPALVAVAGPLAWLLWNAMAHGKATHFVDRVAHYRASMGFAPASMADRLLGYPRALVEHGGAILALGLVGAAVSCWLRPEARRRWAVAAALAGAQMAFLVYGDLRDGAPTHHAERALVALFWLLAAAAVDGAAVATTTLVTSASSFLRRALLLDAALGVLFLGVGAVAMDRLRSPPGSTPSEDRESAIARGLELRAQGKKALVVTPCAYEHFALIAAFGAPERVTIEAPRPSAGPCPDVR